MHKALKPLQLLYCMYAFLLFFILMIPVFLWSAMVIPFGRIKGGNLVYKGCVLWADIWLLLIFIRQKNIYESPLREGQSYIFVVNHISYLDSAVMPKIFRKPLRPLGKVEVSKVPIFGFIYKYVIVSVDRSSLANRARSIQLLKSILQKGISVLVFPEGTFNNTGKPLKDFYDGAFRIAIETGTPIKPVLFVDTFSRLHYDNLFSLTPGINRAVFLKEIDVSGMSLKDTHTLKEKVFTLMEKKLLEYNAKWIKPL